MVQVPMNYPVATMSTLIQTRVEVMRLTICKFVIIMRKGCTQSTKDIISTKFERSKIECALELLSVTVDGI